MRLLMPVLLMPVLLCLSACNRGAAVPTPAENRDLDEAGRLLDNAESDLAGIDESGLAPAPADPQM